MHLSKLLSCGCVLSAPIYGNHLATPFIAHPCSACNESDFRRNVKLTHNEILQSTSIEGVFHRDPTWVFGALRADEIRAELASRNATAGT